MTEKRRYIEYDTETKDKRLSPPLTENDILEAPDHIIYFSTKEEFEQFIQKHQVTSSNQNHINHNKDIEDVIEIKRDITDETSNNKNNKVETEILKQWGGRRIGSGAKKGVSKSQEHKDNISRALKDKKDTQK
jgi:hypothetical protein